MAREIRIRLSDKENVYQIYVVKHVFKPMEAVAFIVTDPVSGIGVKGNVEVKATASTLKEEIEFWLHELKRYAVKKRHQKRSQPRSRNT